jgi:hypothetical protein
MHVWHELLMMLVLARMRVGGKVARQAHGASVGNGARAHRLIFAGEKERVDRRQVEAVRQRAKRLHKRRALQGEKSKDTKMGSGNAMSG